MNTIRDSLRNLTSCVSIKSNLVKTNNRNVPIKTNRTDQFYANNSNSCSSCSLSSISVKNHHKESDIYLNDEPKEPLHEILTCSSICDTQLIDKDLETMFIPNDEIKKVNLIF